MRIKKLAIVAGASGAIGLSMLSAAPAFADYAPSANDIVGVGSDTLQFAGDFLADGDAFGDQSYNSAGNVNKVVNFDATPDANARLAYGEGGAAGVGSAGICDPGTGTNKGTVNSTLAANTGNTVCQLNPTIVLRAGQRPVQRINGSGDGATALANDIAAGTHNIDYARASSNQDAKFVANTAHRITIGTEKFAMVAKTGGNMPPTGLTTAELTKIYSSANTGTNGFGTTGCPTWQTVLEARTMPAVTAESVTSNVATVTTATAHGLLVGSQVTISGLTTNTQFNGTFTVVAVPSTTTFTFALTTANVSVTEAGTIVQTGANAAIVPLVPQAGSGTRSYFLGAVASGGINVASPGNCSITVEENDPTAVVDNNRIEPISGARLNLFLGKDGNGNATAQYFLDPSCKWSQTAINAPGVAGNCGTATNPVSIVTPQATTINVTFYDNLATSGHNGVGAYAQTRSLYIYFADTSLNNTVDQVQPGLSINKIRSLFANPCQGKAFDNTTLNNVSGQQGCTTSGGIVYGPGGRPYIATTAGQTLVSAAGITPGYSYDF